MTRNLACSVAVGALALLLPTTGSAQTFVDVGVWTRGGGGRVVVGGAPVYPVPVYRAPIYRAPIYRPVYVGPPVYVVQPYYRHDRGRHVGWAKKGRGPYGARYGYVTDQWGGGYGRDYYDGYRYGGRDYRRRR